MPNLKANEGCLVVPLFCLFHFHFSCGNAFYQYDSREQHQTVIKQRFLYIKFTFYLHLKHVIIKTASLGWPVPGNSTHVSRKPFFRPYMFFFCA